MCGECSLFVLALYHGVFHSFLSDGVQLSLVWIMGHSYVFWGARQADVRPDGRQLGISRREACIRWLGYTG